jgi:SanA protein
MCCKNRYNTNHMHDEKILRRRLTALSIFVFGVVSGLALLLAPSLIIRSYHQYSYKSGQAVKTHLRVEPRVAIVPGGGITPDGKPRTGLRLRLDAAKELYEQGVVSHIVVSGDNRVASYNEPLAMYNYLREQGVQVLDMTIDRAGNSTYETCERAVKVFNIKEAVLVSQAGHIDRAIYLCRSFGMEAYGYASQEDPALHDYQMGREAASNIKAFINVWFVGEKTNLEPQPPIQ